MRRHALFLLGMHRSGASALAGALAKAGASPGRTMREAPGHEAATLESAPLVALDDALLETLGSRWDSLAPLPDRWFERAGVRELVGGAREIVRAEFADAEVVVVKDARLCRVLPFWREAFEAEGFDVAAALMLRRPREVAASLSRGGPIAPEKALALWLAHLVDAERVTRGLPRVLVSYDKLMDAPAGTLAHVVSGTRLPLQLQGPVREGALAAIRPDLRRHGGDGGGTGGAALGSGLDRALDEGFARLERLSPGADPRREIEALQQLANPALNAAIPPWLALELAADVDEAARLAEAQQLARQRIAALEDALAQSERAASARDRTEAELRERIEQLSRTGNEEGRDARIDEALATLRADVSRISYTLADQPAREQALRLELAQAQRDLYDERSTIGRLSEDIEIVRRTADEQQQQLEAARQHLQAMAEELEQAHAAHAARDAHEASLQQALEEARAESNGLQSERDLARREREQAVRMLDALRPEVETLRRDFAIASKERDAVVRQAAEVGAAVTALRDELARRSSAEAELAQERESLRTDLRQATDRAAALERELSKRAGDLAALTSRYDALARTLGAVEKRWLGRIALGRVRRRG